MNGQEILDAFKAQVTRITGYEFKAGATDLDALAEMKGIVAFQEQLTASAGSLETLTAQVGKLQASFNELKSPITAEQVSALIKASTDDISVGFSAQLKASQELIAQEIATAKLNFKNAGNVTTGDGEGSTPQPNAATAESAGEEIVMIKTVLANKNVEVPMKKSIAIQHGLLKM